MKIAIKADSWQQAINHLKECGFTKVASYKGVGNEHVFRIPVPDNPLQQERFNFLGTNNEITEGLKRS